jgi:hypothetical protein
MAQISVYTFEDKDGNSDGVYQTQDFREAKQYAMDNSLRVIENVYEWSEAIPVEGADFTQWVCEVDMDTAFYLGDEEDGVYFDAKQSAGGDWYMGAVVDCNSANFTDDQRWVGAWACGPLVCDDGPYAQLGLALDAGLNAAVEWCSDNDVHYSEQDMAKLRDALLERVRGEHHERTKR